MGSGFDGDLYSRVYSMHLWSDALDVKQWSSDCFCTKIQLHTLARVQSSGGWGGKHPSLQNTVSGVILPCRLHHMQSISEDLKFFHGGHVPRKPPGNTLCSICPNSKSLDRTLLVQEAYLYLVFAETLSIHAAHYS